MHSSRLIALAFKKTKNGEHVEHHILKLLDDEAIRIEPVERERSYDGSTGRDIYRVKDIEEADAVFLEDVDSNGNHHCILLIRKSLDIGKKLAIIRYKNQVHGRCRYKYKEIYNFLRYLK